MTGLCRHCGAHRELKRDGTLRHHNTPTGVGAHGNPHLVRCPGTGQPPAGAS